LSGLFPILIPLNLSATCSLERRVDGPRMPASASPQEKAGGKPHFEKSAHVKQGIDGGRVLVV
jgi:hypothetical protein